MAGVPAYVSHFEEASFRCDAMRPLRTHHVPRKLSACLRHLADVLGALMTFTSRVCLAFS